MSDENMSATIGTWGWHLAEAQRILSEKGAVLHWTAMTKRAYENIAQRIEDLEDEIEALREEHHEHSN